MENFDTICYWTEDNKLFLCRFLYKKVQKNCYQYRVYEPGFLPIGESERNKVIGGVSVDTRHCETCELKSECDKTIEINNYKTVSAVLLKELSDKQLNGTLSTENYKVVPKPYKSDI